MTARKRAGAPRLMVGAFYVVLLFSAATAFAIEKTYTTNADFESGTLDGVNHDSPGSNQLQLNVGGTTFPVLWIANAGEDTVSKIDTINNKELARYRTWFGTTKYNHGAWSGAAPSRTAVDIQGNVYVANRHFDGRPADIIKILAEGGIDRNGNGTIDTSLDANNNRTIELSETLPMVDSNGNGIIDLNEIQDERIAWAVQVGPSNGLGRSLCIGTDGNLWLGLYNSQAYYKVSAADGSILAGPISTGNHTPYGCLVDKNGILWGSSLSNNLLKLDTKTNTVVGIYGHAGNDYGIAIGTGHVYQANYSGFTFSDYDTSSGTFSYPAWAKGISFSSLGIAVDGNGDIFVGNSSGGVTKFLSSGTPLWSAPAQPGTGDVRGVAVDGNNDIWLIHVNSNVVSKYRGSDGTALGIFPVGYGPYTYSDAAGFAARNYTVKTGTWTTTLDGGYSGVKWGTVSWNGLVPSGANIETKVRVAGNPADLPLQTYQAVSNGAPFALSGRYIQIQSRLAANTAGESPVLYDLTVKNIPLICDVNQDGKVDKTDISLITAARNTQAVPGDPRDYDKDGIITVNDARACATKCTNLNCAP